MDEHTAESARSASVAGAGDAGDAHGTTAPGHVPTLRLSADEAHLLDLHDRSQELARELELLKALRDDQSPPLDADSAGPQDIEAAQQAVLKAVSAFSLQTQIAEMAVSSAPMIRAVHAGQDASSVERRLRELIHARDALSIRHAQVNTTLARRDAARVEADVEYRTLTARNRELAELMLSLAGPGASGADVPGGDGVSARTRAEMEALERACGVARARWRVMKGVVGGVVAGSGVDWAGDETLRELVMDAAD